jgi:hypothetical protein
MPLIDHKMGGFKEGLKLFGKPKNQVISRVSGHTALRSTVSKRRGVLLSSRSVNLSKKPWKFNGLRGFSLLKSLTRFNCSIAK